MSISVLQISPFPMTPNPDNGGRIRIAEIGSAYKRAGHHLIRCSVLTRERDRRSACDLVLPWLDRIRRHHIGAPDHLGPIRQRWATVRSRRLADELIDKLPSAVDIIHIEHPWSIRLAQAVRMHPRHTSARIVYSSHNIEHETFRDICQSGHHWNAAARRICAEMQQAERECAAFADVVWAVSRADAAALERMGARKVLLVPNGCRPIQTGSDVRPPIAERYLFFVGGRYAPNVQGFMEWASPCLPHLPPNTCVVVAGAVGDALKEYPDIRAAIAGRKLILTGRVPLDELNTWILGAQGIILPIDVGGGTNLKTAEALCSDKPVIATSASMRGFEDLMNAPDVNIAATPSAFQDAMTALLSTSPPNHLKRRDTGHLMWDNILNQAVVETCSALGLKK